MDGTCAWGVVFQVVFLGTFVARAVLGALAGAWTYVAVQLLCLDLFVLMIGVGILAVRKARQTEQATLLRQGR